MQILIFQWRNTNILKNVLYFVMIIPIQSEQVGCVQIPMYKEANTSVLWFSNVFYNSDQRKYKCANKQIPSAKKQIHTYKRRNTSILCFANFDYHLNKQIYKYVWKYMNKYQVKVNKDKRRSVEIQVYYALLMSIIIQMSRFSFRLGPTSHTHCTKYSLESNFSLNLFCFAFNDVENKQIQMFSRVHNVA